MNEPGQSIADRWMRFVERIAGDAKSPAQALSGLEVAYADPPRAYHNLNHIADCLGVMDQMPEATGPAIELAIWYHDAIYDPFSKTNEQDSALFMRRAATDMGIANEIIDAAASLILITANHQQAASPDEQVIADIDLSIIASPAPAYDRYALAIRKEYKDVEELAYQTGRQQFLQSLLDAPVLFRTQWARTRRFDQQARANISRELASLQP